MKTLEYISFIEREDFSGYAFLYPPLVVWEKFKSNEKNEIIKSWRKSLYKFPSAGLYVHIPFCKKKCRYCRYFSTELKDRGQVAKFLKSLQNEVFFYKPIFKDFFLSNLCIGGGTPTILSIDELELLLKSIFLNFKFKSDFQFSIESTPGLLTLKKIKLLKNYGLNRLTIGVQTFDKKVLKNMNREQDGKKFFEIFKLARKSKIDKINIDLMYGLPSQTISSFKKDLKKIVSLKPEMVHLNDFIPTSFVELYKNNKIIDYGKILEQKKYSAMTKFAVSLLGTNNYKTLEYDSWALNDNSDNKLLTEAVRDYSSFLALGPGAVSRASGELHYVNCNDIDRYNRLLKNMVPPIHSSFKFDKDEAMRDYILNNLRYGKISQPKFRNLFNTTIENRYQSTFKTLLNRKDISFNGEYYRLKQITSYLVFWKKFLNSFFSKKILKKLKKIIVNHGQSLS